MNVRYAQALCEAIDCRFQTHEDRNRHQVSPENLVDYLYASLHNPHYKKQYADLLAHDYQVIGMTRQPNKISSQPNLYWVSSFEQIKNNKAFIFKNLFIVGIPDRLSLFFYEKIV